MTTNPSLIAKNQDLFTLEFNQSGLKDFLDHLLTTVNNQGQKLETLQNDNSKKIYQQSIQNLFEQFSQLVQINEPELLKNFKKQNSYMQMVNDDQGFDHVNQNFGKQFKNISNSIGYLYQQDQKKTKQIEELQRQLEQSASKSDLLNFESEIKLVLDNVSLQQKKIEDTNIKLQRQNQENTNQLQFQINNWQKQLQEIEKQTLWKIQDCSDLLQKRPNHEFVSTNISQLEDKLSKMIQSTNSSRMQQGLSSLQLTLENQINQQQQHLSTKIKSIKQIQDEIKIQLQNYIDEPKFTQYCNYNKEKMEAFQKKINFFEHSYDPSITLSRIQQTIQTMNFNIEEFQNAINQKLENMQIELSHMGDPKFRGMVFVEKNSIDIHEICSMRDNVNRVKDNLMSVENTMRNFDTEFKSKMNYIESELISSDNSQFKKLIPTKEQIEDWIEVMIKKGKASGKGSGGAFDDDQLKDIICDIIDLKKRTSDTKDMEQRYKRIFQEFDVNNIVKTLHQKLDMGDFEEAIDSIRQEFSNVQQIIFTFKSQFDQVSKTIGRSNFKNLDSKINLNFQKQELPRQSLSNTENQNSIPKLGKIGRPYSAKPSK